MDSAGYKHDPADGNVGTETLIQLGRTVEATKVAVAHVLQISGEALEVEWEVDFPNPTMTRHEAHCTPPFGTKGTMSWRCRQIGQTHDGHGSICQRHIGGSGAG